MVTVVFLVESVVNSGPENVVLDICRCIDRSKYNPIIFSLRNEESKNSIVSKFRDLDIEVFFFGLSFLQQETKTRFVAGLVEKKFLEVGGDILHAHCYHPQLIASKFNGIKTVATIHNISGEDFVMKKGILLGKYMKWRFDNSLQGIGVLVALSDYMMEYYRGKCKNLTKIPNGVSFRPIQDFDKSSFLKSIGVRERVPIITVTGSITERKNVSYIINELKSIQKNFICIIIGSGVKLEECKVIADGDSRFRFEGFKNNVSDYLSVADFYISASKSEGLPLSVLEALNMGVPTLLSDIRPHKEITESMSVEGVYTYPLADRALAAAFLEILDAKIDRHQISQKAISLYSAETMAKAYESIYKSLMQ